MFLRAALAHAIEDERGSLGATARPQPVVAPGEPFWAVFVCTGNRARSPLAEALLRRRVEGLPVRVSSCGTLDLGGLPALPEACAVAAGLGVDLRAHRSQALRPGMLAKADLVLGFEPGHVEAAVGLGQADPRRVFLLLELPTLLDRLAQPQARSPIEGARLVVSEMDEERERTPMDDETFTLPDPYGENRQVFAEMARVTDAMTGLLAARLFPGTAGR